VSTEQKQAVSSLLYRYSITVASPSLPTGRQRTAADRLTGATSCNYRWWWRASAAKTCRAAYRNTITWRVSILFEKLLNFAMTGPMNIKLCNLSRRVMFTRRIQLPMQSCILTNPSLVYNSFQFPFYSVSLQVSCCLSFSHILLTLYIVSSKCVVVQLMHWIIQDGPKVRI